MVFKRECLQCGKKGFFLSLDSNGLCEACRQKIEAARITSKKIQAESFYDRLVTLSRKVLIDPCTCSPEDIRCAHDNCPSFIETLDAIPSIPAFAEAFLAHCSHSNALLVINEDFGPMRLSSGGVCDFGELRTKATHILEQCSKMLDKGTAFQDVLNAIPKANICIDATAPQHSPPSLGANALKISNITRRTSLAKLNIFFAIDVETTGLNPAIDEIIQLSAVKYIGFQPAEVFTSYIKPHKGLHSKAQQINGISEKDVASAPYIETIIHSFDAFLGDNSPVVGHNLGFDYNFLVSSGSDALLKDRKFYDTLDLAKREYSYLTKFNLEYLCRKCLGLIRFSQHDAFSDALATGLLFKHICDTRIAQ